MIELPSSTKSLLFMSLLMPKAGITQTIFAPPATALITAGVAIPPASIEPDNSAANVSGPPCESLEFDANTLVLQEAQCLGNFETTDGTGIVQISDHNLVSLGGLATHGAFNELSADHRCYDGEYDLNRSV